MGQAQGQPETLSAQDFSEKITNTAGAIIVDVRTPDEFAKGHLPDAVNMNWNSEDFRDHIALLDKSSPLFVYCLSGGRSRSAANKMREAGFEQVFELAGGMNAWRATGLPEINAQAHILEGMTVEDYYSLLEENDMVLVDFYAEWCVPCRKMKPYLDRIAEDLDDQITVIRINADENREVSKKLGVITLPVLILYKNLEPVWKHEGYLGEEDIRKRLL